METFNESVLAQSGKVMVKFGAPWCGPCNQVKPILEEMANEGYRIYDVDCDQDQDNTMKFGIRGVPTYIVFENGVEVARDSGAKTREQLNKLYGE